MMKQQKFSRIKFTWLKYPAILLLLISVGSAFSAGNALADGGDSSGGADALTAYRNMIDNTVTKHLKIRVKKFMSTNLSPNQVATFSDPTLRPLLQRLINPDTAAKWPGLLADIDRSDYKPGGPCFDTVLNPPEQRGASALMGRPGTNLCFDTNLLITQDVTMAVLVGLAFHEHAHHAGMGETDAQLIQAFVSAEVLDSGSNDDQVPIDQLNHALISEIKLGEKMCIRSSLTMNGSSVFSNGQMLGVVPYDQRPKGVYCTYIAGNRSKYGSPQNDIMMGVTKISAGTISIDEVFGPYIQNQQTTGMFSIKLSNGDTLACEKNSPYAETITIPQFLRTIRGYIDPGKCRK